MLDCGKVEFSVLDEEVDGFIYLRSKLNGYRYGCRSVSGFQSLLQQVFRLDRALSCDAMLLCFELLLLAFLCHLLEVFSGGRSGLHTLVVCKLVGQSRLCLAVGFRHVLTDRFVSECFPMCGLFCGIELI